MKFKEKLGLKLGFFLGSGANLHVDDRVYVHQDCLRYKDIFIEIGQADDGTYSVGWYKDIPPGGSVRDMIMVKLK